MFSETVPTNAWSVSNLTDWERKREILSLFSSDECLMNRWISAKIMAIIKDHTDEKWIYSVVFCSECFSFRYFIRFTIILISIDYTIFSLFQTHNSIVHHWWCWWNQAKILTEANIHLDWIIFSPFFSFIIRILIRNKTHHKNSVRDELWPMHIDLVWESVWITILKIDHCHHHKNHRHRHQQWP